MNEDRRGGCPVCRSTRRPLLCPNCVNRGHLNNLALRTARQQKQKLLERINWALEVQVRLHCSHSSFGALSLSMLYQDQIAVTPLLIQGKHLSCRALIQRKDSRFHSCKSSSPRTLSDSACCCRERRSFKQHSSSSMQSDWSLSGGLRSTLQRQKNSCERVSTS